MGIMGMTENNIWCMWVKKQLQHGTCLPRIFITHVKVDEKKKYTRKLQTLQKNERKKNNCSMRVPLESLVTRYHQFINILQLSEINCVKHCVIFTEGKKKKKKNRSRVNYALFHKELGWLEIFWEMMRNAVVYQSLLALSVVFNGVFAPALHAVRHNTAQELQKNRSTRLRRWRENTDNKEDIEFLNISWNERQYEIVTYQIKKE